LSRLKRKVTPKITSKPKESIYRAIAIPQAEEKVVVTSGLKFKNLQITQPKYFIKQKLNHQ